MVSLCQVPYISQRSAIRGEIDDYMQYYWYCRNTITVPEYDAR